MNTDLQRKVPYAVSPPRYAVSHQMVTVLAYGTAVIVEPTNPEASYRS